MLNPGQHPCMLTRSGLTGGKTTHWAFLNDECLHRSCERPQSEPTIELDHDTAVNRTGSGDLTQTA